MTLNVDSVFTNVKDAENDYFNINVEGGLGYARIVVKTADETVGDQVLQNDNELLFAVEPNKTYKFEMVIIEDNALNKDIKFKIDVPAGTVGGFVYNGETDSTIRYELRSGSVGTQYTISQFAGDRAIKIEGSFYTGANGGSFIFQWADNAAGNTIVKAGSYILYYNLTI